MSDDTTKVLFARKSEEFLSGTIIDNRKTVFARSGEHVEFPSQFAVEHCTAADEPDADKAFFVFVSRSAPLRVSRTNEVVVTKGSGTMTVLTIAEAVDMAMAVLRTATPAQVVVDAPSVSAGGSLPNNKITTAENWAKAAADQSMKALANIVQMAAREIGASQLCELLRLGVTLESIRRLRRNGLASNFASLLDNMREDRVHAVYLLVYDRVMQRRADLLAETETETAAETDSEKEAAVADETLRASLEVLTRGAIKTLGAAATNSVLRLGVTKADRDKLRRLGLLYHSQALLEHSRPERRRAVYNFLAARMDLHKAQEAEAETDHDLDFN